MAATINFGAGDDTAGQFAKLAQFRPNGPKMCGEYWDGWLDHWGETHHRVPAKTLTQGLEWMVSRGISVNLYMFHGGTTFGFMPGANTLDANPGKQYQPDITSYDYNAPLPAIAIPRFHFEQTVSLWSALGEGEKREGRWKS